LGTSTLLRLGFHIDVWSDAIGPGLRLPHPFNIIIGEGVEIGPACTLLHGVTLQNGSGTRVGQGVFLANGVTVLAGSRIGDGSLIGAASVVRGEIPPASVAVGAPARVVRATRPSEAAT
jgi:serine O-acetyltransferase